MSAKLSLEWRYLENLLWLQALEVYHLTEKEAESLGEAVIRLPLLKRLLIASSRPTSSIYHTGSGDHVSPLTTFFNRVFPTDDHEMRCEGFGNYYGLPSTLQSLILLDDEYKGY